MDKPGKIKTVTIDELYQEQVDQGNIEVEGFNYRLNRSDGLTKISKDAMWIEWNEDRTFKAKHTEPAVGRSLMMSPFGPTFTWQTTKITELIETTDKLVKFKTGNSDYELIIGPVDVT